MLQRELGGLFTVSSFNDGQVCGELTLEELAQVAPLSDVVFGYQDCHQFPGVRTFDRLFLPWLKVPSRFRVAGLAALASFAALLRLSERRRI
jgi:hypothetical protein